MASPQINTQFNIDLIYNHLPGWEYEWERLLNAIYVGNQGTSNTNNNGPLKKACREIIKAHSAPNEPDIESKVEEFQSNVIYTYQNRVHSSEKSKRLFNKWQPINPQTGIHNNPIAYLCTLRHLEMIYRSYYNSKEANKSQVKFSKNGQKRIVNIYQASNCPINQNDDKEVSYSDILQVPKTYKSANTLKEEENHQKNLETIIIPQICSLLVLEAQKKGGKSYDMASIQLYPNLSPTNPEVSGVRQHACSLISNIQNCSEIEADKILMERHQAAQKALEEKNQDLRIKIKRIYDNLDEENIKDRDKKLEKHERFNEYSKIIIWNKYFSPLKGDDIQELLGISIKNTATVQIKRYNEKLKDIFLLPHLQEFLEKIIK